MLTIHKRQRRSPIATGAHLHGGQGRGDRRRSTPNVGLSAWEAIRHHSAGGNYVSRLLEEDDRRVHEAYGQNLNRLAKVKAAYDPHKLFRVNRTAAPQARSHEWFPATEHAAIRVGAAAPR